MEDKMAGAAFGRATNYGPTLEWRSKVNKIYIKKRVQSSKWEV